MTELFSRRVYTYNGIGVAVEIDFIKKKVSIVEKDGQAKQWLFAGRELEYMDGQHVRFAMYINGAITGPFIVIRADEMDPFIQRIKPTIYEDLK